MLQLTVPPAAPAQVPDAALHIFDAQRSLALSPPHGFPFAPQSTFRHTRELSAVLHRSPPRQSSGLVAHTVLVTQPPAAASRSRSVVVTVAVAVAGARRVTECLGLIAARRTFGVVGQVLERGRLGLGLGGRHAAVGFGAALGLAVLFAVGTLPGALAFGASAAFVFFLGLAAGWAYDLGLKRTPLSFLPFAVAFPLLPIWVGLVAGRALPGLLTFFVVGAHVGQYPAVIREALADGDEIGNHTYTHADLLWLGNGDIAAQLANTQSTIRASTGFTPRWFRPPGGDYTVGVADAARQAGMALSMWTTNSGDWALPPAKILVERVLVRAEPGAIVLMHNGTLNTVQALPRIIVELRRRGYRFVTVSQLARNAE